MPQKKNTFCYFCTRNTSPFFIKGIKRNLKKRKKNQKVQLSLLKKNVFRFL